MKRYWIIASILLALLLVACGEDATPTSEKEAAKPLPGLPVAAAETSPVTLLRNPGAFEDQLVRVSGQYQPNPIPVCSDETHLSPATWTLVNGDAEVPAAGFDTMLRELGYPGMAMVVEGQWRFWQGPVGCGRRAPAVNLWYLDVTTIISPNPIVAATPGGETGDEVSAGAGTAVAEVTPQPGEGGPLPTASEAGEAGIPVATPTLSGGTATGIETLSPTVTLTPFSTVTATPSGSATVTFTPGPTVTASPTGTTTPGSTGQSGTATPTATPGVLTTASPTATTAAGAGEQLDFDDLVVDTLSSGEVKIWRFNGISGDRVTVNTGPIQGLDVSLELLNPSGTSMLMANSGGGGFPESLGEVQLNQSGNYQIIVRAMNGNGQYALVLLTDESLPFMVFRGNMIYGQTKNRTIAEDMDDLWVFQGNSGDSITIRAEATGSEDIVLYLNGPDGLELDFADIDTEGDAPPDDTEEISNFPLPQSGLYTIGVGESDFLPIGYVLTLTRN